MMMLIMVGENNDNNDENVDHYVNSKCLQARRGGLEDNDNNDDGNNNDGDNHDKRSKARGTFEVRSLKKTPHLYWFLQIVM